MSHSKLNNFKTDLNPLRPKCPFFLSIGRSGPSRDSPPLIAATIASGQLTFQLIVLDLFF